MRTISISIVALGVAACAAPTTEDVAPKLKQLSASVIPGADASTVIVSDAQQTMAKWVWRASVGGQNFRCDSDGEFRLPSCSALES